MGDKSPKAFQKKASQQKAKFNKAEQVKNQGIAAKQAGGKKK